MAWKLATCILAALVLLEGALLLLGRRRAINRFKPVDENHYFAFDPETGQLCTTFRPSMNREPKLASPSSTPAPSSSPSRPTGSRTTDLILKAMDEQADASTKEADNRARQQAELEERIGFIRGLPACADIR